MVSVVYGSAGRDSKSSLLYAGVGSIPTSGTSRIKDLGQSA